MFKHVSILVLRDIPGRCRGSIDDTGEHTDFCGWDYSQKQHWGKLHISRQPRLNVRELATICCHPFLES